MNNLAQQTLQVVALLQKNLYFTLMILAVLFGIHMINWIIGYRLNVFGIVPRKIIGLPGIVLSPFLHANFNHLFFNSIPLFVMVSFILLQGMTIFLCVSAIIIVLGGFGTWLFGRRGIHIGASGVIMGYWSYLLIEAYKHPTVLSIALAVVCLYYFGGMVLNLFPMKVKSSWEAHFFGFLAGLAAAYIMPYLLGSLMYHHFLAFL
jgi:membrane associated rhomboid family serine protease